MKLSAKDKVNLQKVKERIEIRLWYIAVAKRLEKND